MLRRTLLASVGAIALTGSAAFAADLPSRAPPPVYLPPPPIFTWTGLYVGINAGGTWSNNNTVDVDTVNVFSIGGLNGDIPGEVATLGTGDPQVSNSGFIGGGQIGYNWQFANSWVVGIEADIQGIAGGSRTGSVAQSGFVPGSVGGACPGGTICASSVITASKDSHWLGTVRGRLGFTITPTLLVYGTGGLAYGEVSSRTSITEQLAFIDTPNPFGTFGNLSTTRVGWTAGGGLEWLFAPNWSLKVEYLYYDLGSVTYALAPIQQFGVFGTLLETTSASRSTTRFNDNIVRAGLNYHFTFPAPIVAKY
jgi:outer membrane immunogenic protein